MLSIALGLLQSTQSRLNGLQLLVEKDQAALDILHAAIVDQARLTGDYPYVLARADELAVISHEEREAVEMMLALEMRRLGLTPDISSKQRSKNAFRSRKRGFNL